MNRPSDSHPVVERFRPSLSSTCIGPQPLEPFTAGSASRGSKCATFFAFITTHSLRFVGQIFPVILGSVLQLQVCRDHYQVRPFYLHTVKTRSWSLIMLNSGLSFFVHQHRVFIAGCKTRLEAEYISKRERFAALKPSIFSFTDANDEPSHQTELLHRHATPSGTNSNSENKPLWLIYPRAHIRPITLV